MKYPRLMSDATALHLLLQGVPVGWGSAMVEVETFELSSLGYVIAVEVCIINEGRTYGHYRRIEGDSLQTFLDRWQRRTQRVIARRVTADDLPF